MSDYNEIEIALMEGARNGICEEYFAARPRRHNPGNQKLFEDGFIRGWESALQSKEHNHDE